MLLQVSLDVLPDVLSRCIQQQFEQHTHSISSQQLANNSCNPQQPQQLRPPVAQPPLLQPVSSSSPGNTGSQQLPSSNPAAAVVVGSQQLPPANFSNNSQSVQQQPSSAFQDGDFASLQLNESMTSPSSSHSQLWATTAGSNSWQAAPAQLPPHVIGRHSSVVQRNLTPTSATGFPPTASSAAGAAYSAFPPPPAYQLVPQQQQQHPHHPHQATSPLAVSPTAAATNHPTKPAQKPAS